MSGQHLTDNSDLRKYRVELPNMVDDIMDPFQARLYLHYKRVCGAGGGSCYESVRTTATKTQMSNEKVINAREWLAANGWIDLEQGSKNIYTITIVDRWVENFTRYGTVRNSERAPLEIPNTTVRNSERAPLEISKQRSNHLKKEPIKKEPSKEVTTTTIGTHRDHSDHGGGGGSTKSFPIAAAELKPAVKTTTTAPQADPRRKAQLALIAEIINDRLPSWNAHQSYAAALSTLDAWRLLTWLWVFDALARCAELSAYDPDDIRETERIEGAYGKVFAGIEKPVGFIRTRVSRGESTSLTAPDAAELEEAIVARSTNA